MKKIIPIMLFITIIFSVIIPVHIYAKNGIASTKILFYDGTLIENKKNVTISIAENKRAITKAEVKQINSNITDIVNSEDVALADTDKVKTGDKIKVGETEYTVILYGDASGDGKCSETDDLMAVASHYLESKKEETNQDKNKILTDENFIAADIANKKDDKVLDIEDISKMINIYLEKSNDVVEKEPEGNIEPKKEENSLPVGTKVKYLDSNGNSVAGRIWRIFFIDEDNKFGDGKGTIYLKADWVDNATTLDNITYSNKTLMSKLNPMWAKSDNVINTDCEQASAWLLDPTIWEKDYKSNNESLNDKINYVVGAPTLEMFYESYKKNMDQDINVLEMIGELQFTAGHKGEKGYAFTRKTVNGYTTMSENNAVRSSVHNGLFLDLEERDTNRFYHTYWLASPAWQEPIDGIYEYGSIFAVMAYDCCVGDDGVKTPGGLSYADACPIVSLKPGTQLEVIE